jgi:integrase
MSSAPKKKQVGRTPNEQMHGDLTLGDNPPRASNNASFQLEEIDICDGAVKVLRTRQSGDVWQMRLWVCDENRYFRKSLRTKDIELAKEKARKIYYQMMGQIEVGRRIFSISMGELVEKYMEHQQQRVDAGFIVQGRHTTIRTQLKHLLSFVGEGTKLDTIRNNKYRDYYTFRKKHHPEVKNPTLINERATIGNLYKWAMEQGYVNQSQLPVWSEIRKTISYRNAMQRDEYRVLYTYLRNWHQGIKDEREVYERKLVRDFILVLANTGMRFGEARFTKWHSVEVVKSALSKYPNVHIRIPKENSKVRKDRTAIGMRGDIFKRIKEYSRHTHQQDYVFADYDTGEAISRKTLYRLWDVIREESGLSEFPEDYSYYSLRHTYATYRLQLGNVDVFTLSKVMGCSVKYIEEHYGQIQTEKMTDYITRTKSTMDDVDGLFLE